MTAKLYDLAKMTVSGTPGAGTITLGAALAPFLTFAQAGVQDGDVVFYAIIDASNVEIGYGTYTAAGTLLSRDNVYRSSGASNTGKISVTSAAIVIIAPAAEFLNSPGGFISRSTITATNASLPIPAGATKAKIRAVAGGGGVGLTTGPDGGDTVIASGTQSITTLTCHGGKGSTTNLVPANGGALSTNGDLNLAGGMALITTDWSTSGGAVHSGSGPLTPSLSMSVNSAASVTAAAVNYGGGAIGINAANPIAAGNGSYLEKDLTGLTPGNTLSVTIGPGGIGTGTGAGTGAPGIVIIEWYS